MRAIQVKVKRDDYARYVVLLDTRNMKELTHGTFERALTLPIGKFTEFPTALEQHREALRGLNLLIQS